MSENAGKLLRKDWSVSVVTLDVAVALVEREHYAEGASNTATYRHGLFRAGDIFDSQCVGVAIWLPPTKSAALATYPERWQGVLSLSRLAIEPGVPKNAATFLIGASMRMVCRKTWPCLVTYADEWRGHTGAIYRATNWRYAGLTRPERVYTIDGRMVARKAGPKTRTHSEMMALGAVCHGAFQKHKFVHVINGRKADAEEATTEAAVRG